MNAKWIVLNPPLLQSLTSWRANSSTTTVAYESNIMKMTINEATPTPTQQNIPLTKSSERVVSDVKEKMKQLGFSNERISAFALMEMLRGNIVDEEAAVVLGFVYQLTSSLNPENHLMLDVLKTFLNQQTSPPKT